MGRTASEFLSVVPLPTEVERWWTTLKVSRIKIDGDRWTAEISFTPVAFDPDYWLSRSDGFLVDSPDRGLGVVDEVVRTADGEIHLAVAGGWFGRRRYLIPASEVEEILPGPQRILVRATAVEPEPGDRRRRFPSILLEGPPNAKLDDREADRGGEGRRVALPPEHAVIQVLGTDDGR